MHACPSLDRLLAVRRFAFCVLPLALAACGEAPPPRPVIPPGLRVDDPAPPPPRPGRASVKASGAVAFEADGAWGTSDAEPPDFRLSAADVVGVGANPAWHVFTLSKGRVGAGLDRVVLHVGGRTFERSAPFPAGALTVEARRLRFDGLLVERGGAAEVRLALDVEYPDVVPAAPAPPAVLALLAAASGAKARPWSTWEFGRSKDERCASAIVPAEHGRALVRDLRARLGPGWIAFVGTTQWHGDDAHDGVELVIGPGTTPLDALRLARTDGANYDLGTEGIVRQLQAWDAEVGVDVWHAESDTTEIELARPPKDAAAFARALYAFCPDIVDQGGGSVDDLARRLRSSRDVLLWWD